LRCTTPVCAVHYTELDSWCTFVLNILPHNKGITEIEEKRALKKFEFQRGNEIRKNLIMNKSIIHTPRKILEWPNSRDGSGISHA
jgi:hypothetical protein